jgi:DNA-binding MarR family transcriptional regulator/DNA-binding HxlR family transcriptional regulator
MTKTDLLPLAREAMTALAVHYSPAMQQARDAAGMQQADWWPVFVLSYADQRPVSSAYIHQLTPYVSLAGLDQRLADAASRGLIQQTDNHAFRLTELGRRALHGALEAAWVVMAKLEPLPADDLRRLTDLLKQVVDASLAAPQPRDKRHLAVSRSVDPGDDAPLVARVDQYLTDLVLFRDDVHPAAWREYNVDGPAWEVFTLIWAGDATTLADLEDKLANRRHPPQLIAQALQDLGARGWVARHNGGYAVTDEGRRLRQEAEDETDRLFYAPWSTLGDAEIEELRGLLARLRDQAQPREAQRGG